MTTFNNEHATSGVGNGFPCAEVEGEGGALAKRQRTEAPDVDLAFPLPTWVTGYEFCTHTFSECVENHPGMLMTGKKRECGFSEAHLAECAERCGAVVHALSCNGERASVMVIKGGVDYLLGKNGANALYAESLAAPFDSKFKNTRRNPPWGMVQNKWGRKNNCYADAAQNPDIPAGKGTIIAFNDAPMMAKLRAKLPSILGNAAENLYAETNLYTDVRSAKVGIGFHGDGERKIVCGVRLGKASATAPLRFQWFHRSKTISEEYVIELDHGDLYVMSDKAVGSDWRSPSLTTLRHGAGQKAKLRAVGS